MAGTEGGEEALAQSHDQKPQARYQHSQHSESFQETIQFSTGGLPSRAGKASEIPKLLGLNQVSNVRGVSEHRNLHIY